MMLRLKELDDKKELVIKLMNFLSTYIFELYDIWVAFEHLKNTSLTPDYLNIIRMKLILANDLQCTQLFHLNYLWHGSLILFDILSAIR